MKKEEQFSSRVVKDSTIVSAGSLVARFAGLGSTLMVLYILSVYEYGLYKLVFATYGLLASFLFSGIDNIVLSDAAVYRGRSEFEHIKRIFYEFTLFRLILSLFLWLGVFFGANFIGRFYSENIVSFLKIISFLFLANFFKTIIIFAFRIELKFLAVSLNTILYEVIKFACILFFFFVFGWGIEGVLWAYVLATFLSIAFLLPFSFSFFRSISGTSASSSHILFQMIKGHGKWGVLSSYSMDVQKNLQPWIVKFFLGTEAVAIVSVAQSLKGYATSVLPLSEVLMPTVPRYIDDKERLKRIFFRGIKYSTIVFALVAVGVFFVATPFINFLFPKYVSSLPVFNILILSLLITGVANILTSLFYAFKMQKDLFFITIYRLPFMVVASLVLFPLFGLIGVAVQLVLTFCFFVGMRYYRITKVMPELSFSFKEMFKFDPYDRALLNKIKVYIKSKFSWRKKRF